MAPRFRIIQVLLASAIIVTSTEATAYEPCTLETASLRGTVLDIDGNPARNANVSWYGIEWRSDCRLATGRRHETHTDSIGEYSLEVPATLGSLSVETIDRFGSTREFVYLEEVSRGESRRDYRFRIIRVEGHVLGPDGFPALEGKVIYYPDPGGAMICGTGLPESPITKGSFTVTLRRPGPYVFSISPSPPGICSISSIVSISADTTITFSLDGHAVEGRVSLRDGRPLPHATIWATGRRAGTSDTTDNVGRYRMYLPEGTYRWNVIPKEQWMQPRSFGWDSVSSPHRRDFEMEGVEWSGRVVNAATEEPVDSIEILGYSGGPDSPSGDGIYAVTGPEGRFHFMVRTGFRFDVFLRDYRVGPVPRSARPPDDDPMVEEERIEREYARVRSRWIRGLTATRDSTFDITMEPVTRVDRQRSR